MSEPLSERCPDCAAYLRSDQAWNLAAACASVGIEYGKSTHDMARAWFVRYHAEGHRDKR